MSARILGDTLALAASPDCSRLCPWITGAAITYQEKCYDSSVPASDCNLYVNRTIDYPKETRGACPFKDNICLDGPITFDIGYVDASTIGLNTPEKYRIRKLARCAQIHRAEHPMVK